MARNRSGYGVTLKAAGPPEFLAGVRIVGDQEFVAADDQLSALRGFDDDRRRPAYLNRTFDAPDLFARLFIQCGHERVLAVELLVAKQDQQILVQHRRSPHAHSYCADVTERLFPDQLAVEAVAIDGFRTEIGIDVFAVGDGGGSGVIAALMAVVVDAAFVRGLLPQYLPGVAVEAERLEGVELVHPVPIVMRELFIADYSLGRLVARGFGAAFDVSGQENFFAPDDRLRKSLTGDRRLPQNVLRHVPFSRRIFVVRNALGVRAAPLRPVG